MSFITVINETIDFIDWKSVYLNSKHFFNYYPGIENWILKIIF